MSNLFYGGISSGAGEYKNLATEASIIFEADTKYVLENRNGNTIYLCVKASTPTNGEGFSLRAGEKCEYTHGSDNLYFRTKGATINIAS